MSSASTGTASGDLLRRLRVRSGLSQQELAVRSGISVRTLRSLEKGSVARPHAASIARLARALSVPADDIAALLAGDGADGDSAAQTTPDGWIHVAVLGPLKVRRDHDTVLEVGSPMARTLLGLLALQAGEVVGLDAIVDLLWPHDPPRTCQQLIHTYVRQLRQILEPGRDARAPARVLCRTAGGYRLDLDADRLDLAEFEQVARRAAQAWSSGAAEAAWQLYTEAWNCWRGPLLAGSPARLRDHPAAAAATRARLATILEGADVALGLGYCDRMIGPLQAACAEEPLHEGLTARLMLALAADGDQAAALQLFGTVRRRLDEQLGVEPGRELQAAYLRVLRGQLPVAMRPMPSAPQVSAAQGAATVPAHLPIDVAGFTGREADLRALDDLLPAPDLHAAQPVIVTIAGMGGVGKTALAVHWAHRVRDRFPDGQLYVNLRGYSEDGPLRPIDALAGLLHALGVSADRVPADETQAAAMYRSRLSGRRVLVLLDNAISAQQVRPLLPSGPGSLAVVTSRERMAGLVARDGARWSTLDALPPQESAALLDRMLGAQRVAAEPEAAAQLARLCAHLPLALRIAAANLAIRPRHRIAAYVERLSAGDRLAALEADGDSSTAVRATFKLSCSSLPAVEQRVFRLLGVVPGPDTTADAVAALAGLAPTEAERILDRLAGRHLVIEHVPGRYTLHDLLRLYAGELAAEAEAEADRAAAVHRFAAHFRAGLARAAQLLYPYLLHLPGPYAPVPLVSAGAGPTPAVPAAPAVAAAPDVPTASGPAPFPDGAAALAWLDLERDNLVALIVHLAERGHHAAAWGLADLINGYFMLRLNLVDWQVVAEAASRASYAGGDTSVQAAAEIRLGMVHDVQCRYSVASGHHSRAAALARQAGWTACQAVALNNLARSSWVDGDVDMTVELLTEALALNRAAGRRAGEAVTLANLAVARAEWGLVRGGEEHRASLEAAESLLTEALEMHRRIGDARNEGDTLRCLAQVHRDAGALPRALELAEQALHLARITEDVRFEITALNALATVRVRLGQGESGLECHALALRAAREIGDRRLQAQILLDMADTHVRLGQHDEARMDAQDVVTVARQINSRLLERQAERVLDAIRPAEDRGLTFLPVSAARTR